MEKETLVEVVSDYLLKLDEIRQVQATKHNFVVKQNFQDAAKQRLVENDLNKEALALIAKMKKLRKTK